MALKRRLTNNVSKMKGLGRLESVFTEEQEQELVEYILDMEAKMYGLTARDVRCLAFQLAERNKINHPFSQDKQAAGKDWLANFRSRHPQLTVRSAESSSIARAGGFNKPVVDTFHNLLKQEITKHKFPPHQIFNVDETSSCIVPGKNSENMALRGR
ncbi:hypothetical protein JTB14_024681 [Gonioctena quinquepunctata]|nr:hypothetical protein JTB14_024681 [Gonioctena quinquepunctata]